MRLSKLFTAPIPIENLKTNTYELNGARTDEFHFDLIGKKVVIEITKLPSGDHTIATYILGGLSDQIPIDAVGYNIIFRVDGATDVTSGGSEFVIFNAILKIVNDYFKSHDWYYIQFQGAEGSRNKLYNALAQRMTKTQPHVKQIAQRYDDFIITKF